MWIHVYAIVATVLDTKVVIVEVMVVVGAFAWGVVVVSSSSNSRSNNSYRCISICSSNGSGSCKSGGGNDKW